MSDESWTPNVTLTDCRWQVAPPSPVLDCAVHGRRTPAHRQDECGAGPAVLCHVCLREVVPPQSRTKWSFLCPTCTRIEAALAEPFGAPALTPHRGQSGTQAATLFGRRFPNRVHQLEVEVRPVPGTAVKRLITRDRLEGPEPLRLLSHHAESEFALLGGDGTQPVTTWLTTRPSSPGASAEAYLRYVTWQHEWLLAEIPRLADLDWLTAVASGE